MVAGTWRLKTRAINLTYTFVRISFQLVMFRGIKSSRNLHILLTLLHKTFLEKIKVNVTVCCFQWIFSLGFNQSFISWSLTWLLNIIQVFFWKLEIMNVWGNNHTSNFLIIFIANLYLWLKFIYGTRIRVLNYYCCLIASR